MNSQISQLDTPVVKQHLHTAPARRQGRTSPAALGKVTAALLVGIGLAATYVSMMLHAMGHFEATAIVLVAVPLVGAALIAAGWRWTPVLGALVGALPVAAIAPSLREMLAASGDPLIPAAVVMLVLGALAIPVGIGATVQNYRRAPQERRAPRWLGGALAAAGGLTLGTILMFTMAPRPAAAGISPEVLATLPALTTENFAFDQPEIRVKAGEMVALRLENKDAAYHSFDLDEFGVHAPMPSGESGIALFRAEEAGTYTFYCAPHYDKKTGQGMKGTLIVEP